MNEKSISMVNILACTSLAVLGAVLGYELGDLLACFIPWYQFIDWTILRELELSIRWSTFIGMITMMILTPAGVSLLLRWLVAHDERYPSWLSNV